MKDIRSSGAFLFMTLVFAVASVTGIAAAQRPAVDVTGIWQAVGVPYAPWIFQFKQDGGRVTGTMQQNGALVGLVNVEEGTIDGARISFKGLSPDGARRITFTGTVDGDEMILNRSTQNITSASPGGTGLFGTNAAPQFSIRRGGAILPTTTVTPARAVTAATTTAAIPAGAQRWVAMGVGFAPWTFDLKIDDGLVTGVIGQASTDPATSTSTSLVGPFELFDGKADGGRITFKARTPDGGRIVTFTGNRDGNQIAFNRSVQVLSGDAGRNGILGGAGATQFVAVLDDGRTPVILSVPALSVPAVTAVPPGTERWIAATGVGFAPWTFDLKFDDGLVRGVIGQAGTDPPTGTSTSLVGPYEIFDGKAEGSRITFKARTPDGGRIVTFNGNRDGDQIAFTRNVQVLSGDAGRNGILGGAGATQFSAVRDGSRAGASPATISADRSGPSGRWQATAVPNAPWTFEFAVSGSVLTGSVRQSGAQSLPANVAAGTVEGSTITFKVLSPDAERLVTFRGTVNGNEISFVRQIDTLPGGSRGGNDLYGASAPLQFVATRVR